MKIVRLLNADNAVIQTRAWSEPLPPYIKAIVPKPFRYTFTSEEALPEEMPFITKYFDKISESPVAANYMLRMD